MGKKKKKKNWVLLTDSTRTEQSGFGGWEGGQAARSDSCPTASWIVGERWQLCWELLGMFSTWCQASAWAASERNLRKWWASASLWSRHLAVGEPGGRKAATRARAPFHLCGWRGRCSIVNGAASETRNLSRPLTSCVLWWFRSRGEARPTSCRFRQERLRRGHYALLLLPLFAI